jgi:hypothetical protein
LLFTRHRSIRAIGIWTAAILAIIIPGSQVLARAQDNVSEERRHAGDSFACGGHVEREAWKLWETSVRDWARKSLSDRLKRDGDVYVLYDLQTYLHNLSSMARRCQRVDRLTEIASVLRPAYESLEPGGWLSPGRRWVCRGGRICSGNAGLLGQEVQLVSVQFLGLTSSVANALVTAQRPLQEDAQAFIRTTSIVIAEHMQRWGDRKAIDKLADAAGARPEDVKPMSTGLLFTDKPLWMIGIYAEWAGILESGHESIKLHVPDDHEREVLARHLRVLLRLFNARLSYRSLQHPQFGDVKTAELDRGYWRLLSDHRYAGYEGKEKPLVCPDKNKARANGAETGAGPQQRIDAASVPRPNDIGWDLSHARRLVHVLGALDRNRTAMNDVFGTKESELPPPDLPLRFANAMAVLSWNGDRRQPLFSNYLSGANGWYRVGYAPAGGCNEGTPPFGLSESFVTGGYAVWGRYQPAIRQAGRRLYQMTAQAGPAGTQDGDFIARYYPAFSNSAPPMGRVLSNVMFLPSLVGVAE